MQISLYTPLYQHSQTIPHLVEHCVGKQSLIQYDQFFDNIYAWHKEILGEWTIIQPPQWLTFDQVLALLTQPLEKAQYHYESKILRQECRTMHQGSRIFEAMLQQLIDPKIVLTSATGKTWAEVYRYHQHYYHPENMIWYDDEIAPLQDYTTRGASYYVPHSGYCNTPLQEYFHYDGVAFILYGYTDPDPIHYWLCWLWWIVIKSYLSYRDRYQGGCYESEGCTIDQFRSSIWLTLPNGDYSGCDQGFFEQAKAYMIHMMSHYYFRNELWFARAVLGYPFSREEIIELYASYTRPQFYHEFLKPLHGLTQ